MIVSRTAPIKAKAVMSAISRVPIARATCRHLSTLPTNNLLSHHMMDESSSSERTTKSPVQLTMVPNSDQTRSYGTSSFEEPSLYDANWSKAAHQTVTMKQISKPKNNLQGSESDEFDPILDIRAMNPLIFESNYELEDYGPSFEGSITDRIGSTQ